MTMDEYDSKAAETAIYNKGVHEEVDQSLIYTVMGLVGETGEVAEKLKKRIRDGVWDEEEVKKELGDVLWYLSGVCREMGFTLQDVARSNLQKLGDRKKRNKLGGSGDNR